MTKVDISFVVPPTRAYSQIVPFPFIYLAAYLEKMSFTCRIVDIKSKETTVDEIRIEKESIQEVLKINPPYVGFTCLTAEYFSVMRMAKMLRSEGYKGVIVVGGHHPTFCPNDLIFENSPFNYAVLGEGEVTLFELLNTLENKGDISKVTGIAFFSDTGYLRTMPRMVIEDLSILPMPSYHLLDMNFYTTPRTSIIRHSMFSGVDIQTTRGCPCNCTYCGNPTLWEAHNYKKRFRCRPIPFVLDEIEYLYNNYNIDSFYVNDDSFTVSDARVKEFCDGLHQRRLNHLVWGIQTRVNIFTENMAKALKESGCVQAEFGVESGSQRVLNVMKKGITIEQVRRTFSICRKYKLRTFANFMVNNPTETEDDLKITITLAKELKATHYGFFITVPLLGTEIYEEYVKPKLTVEEYSLYLGSRPYREIVDPRFKLCKYEKNMRLLALWLFIRFTAKGLYLDPVKSFIKYFKFYMTSKRRKQYLAAFWNIYFGHFTRHFNILVEIFKNRFFQRKKARCK